MMNLNSMNWMMFSLEMFILFEIQGVSNEDSENLLSTLKIGKNFMKIPIFLKEEETGSVTVEIEVFSN